MNKEEIIAFLSDCLSKGIADEEDIKKIASGDMRRLKTLAYLYSIEIRKAPSLKQFIEFETKVNSHKGKRYASILKSLEQNSIVMPITKKVDILNQEDSFEEAIGD